jgi:transposase
LAHKRLWQVERSVHELKSGLEIRPVFPCTEEHVRGHIVVWLLALALRAAMAH